jgi:SpoVK/Ycf46/Vps4 family AAA+-type ATPase
VGVVAFTASRTHQGNPAVPAAVPKQSSAPATPSTESRILADLIDPAKLATLRGDRAANSRLRKTAYWIELAGRSGQDIERVFREAQRLAAYENTPRAEEDRTSLLRNRTILERLGCLDEAGMQKLRKGNAPTITKGPYAGDIASVDHILPSSVVPELDTSLYNLEFMPSKLNGKKGATVGRRQVTLAGKWHRVGLLSEAGLRAVSAKAAATSGR